MDGAEGHRGAAGTPSTLRVKREELSLTIGIKCYGAKP
jgi:hypothetical protein